MSEMIENENPECRRALCVALVVACLFAAETRFKLHPLA